MTRPPLKDCREILKELQVFKDPTVGNWFVKILSASMTRKKSYPLLNVQCLTLNHPYFECIVGIFNALRYSPALERLVIKLRQHGDANVHLDSKLNKFRSNYLDSNVTGFTSLASHLKNAKTLQKMKVIVADDETDFLNEVFPYIIKLSMGL